MTYAQFAFIVRRRELEAKYHPTWYRARVFLLILLAYAFIFTVLLFALGLLAGIGLLLWSVLRTGYSSGIFTLLNLLVPVMIGALILVAVILRSLWVQVPEPPGIGLEREQAVPLFLEIDRLRARLRVPRFHRVILTDDMNAGVVQVPRLGILGWQKNFLLIGVPLMMVLSSEDFQAVLAHEMGHISRAHGAFGGWVYRLEGTWARLLRVIEAEQHWGAVPCMAFFRWYAPYFATFTFVLRRQDEYDADRTAASVVGTKTMAAALSRLQLVFRHLKESQKAGDTALTRHTAARWLNDAMSVKENVSDTHPPLAARLRALGEKPEIPAPLTQTAADTYLGHRLIALAQSVGLVVEVKGAPTGGNG
jgi:Zn-dependent protease with chaperone function